MLTIETYKKIVPLLVSALIFLSLSKCLIAIHTISLPIFICAIGNIIFLIVALLYHFLEGRDSVCHSGREKIAFNKTAIVAPIFFLIFSILLSISGVNLVIFISTSPAILSFLIVDIILVIIIGGTYFIFGILNRKQESSKERKA